MIDDCEKSRLSGKKRSVLYAEQRRDNEGKLARLRFERSILFYLDAPREVLDGRLDRRVVKMRTGGLRMEIEQFWKEVRF